MSAHFFITGGTGLVGTNLIPRLLRRYPGSTITLLVRARDAAGAGERVRAIAARIAHDEALPDAAGRVRGVRGDVALEQCGLEPAQAEQIVAETTHIIHGAATIRFDHPIEEARAINCGGTRRMLTLAHTCAVQGRLEQFAYIGTSSVSGKRSGPIYEHELEMGQSFFNTYEQSKCESERLVRDHAGDLPVIVFRPSIIIGDSRTGRTSTFNVIYIPLRLLHKGLLTAVPGRPSTTLDLVPIDWVDDAMVAIMSRPGAAGTVYHLTAGPERAALLGDVVRRAAGYFDSRTPLARPRVVDFITQEEFISRRSSRHGREQALMAQLDTLLPYVSVDRLFHSGNADAVLRESDVAFPPFSDYAERIFSYCVDTGWGKRV